MNLIILGCNNEPTNYDTIPTYHSQVKNQLILEANSELNIAVDELTINKTSAISYLEKYGKEYLFYFNHNRYALDFYEISDSSTLAKRIKLPRGSKSIFNQIAGYYVQSLDSIYLFDANSYSFKLINDSANVISAQQNALNDQTIDQPVIMSQTKSMPLQMDNSFYLPGIAWHMDNEGTYDYFTLSSNFIKINFNGKHATGITYPKVYHNKYYGISYEYKSFCKSLLGDSLVISFPADPSLYIADKQLKISRQIRLENAFDQGMKSFSSRTMNPEKMSRQLWESPFYPIIISDPWRNVYYQIVYPPTNYTKKHERILPTQSPHDFIIKILDLRFNTVGLVQIDKSEKLLPAMAFVGKGGLYISKHTENEDLIKFEKFIIE